MGAVRRRLRNGTLPEPPVNVRLVAGDGTVYAVELAWIGFDERGFSTWEATTVVPIHWQEGEDYKLLAEAIPPRTAIRIRGERA